MRVPSRLAPPRTAKVVSFRAGVRENGVDDGGRGEKGEKRRVYTRVQTEAYACVYNYPYVRYTRCIHGRVALGVRRERTIDGGGGSGAKEGFSARVERTKRARVFAPRTRRRRRRRPTPTRAHGRSRKRPVCFPTYSARTSIIRTRVCKRASVFVCVCCWIVRV